MKNSIYIVIILLLTSCSKKNKYEYSLNKIDQLKFDEEFLIDWYKEDLEMDSVPGISLNKLFDEMSSELESQEVIIAILDQPVNLKLPELNENIWINIDEIPNNEIDDDKNGYVDDINGWNFLGNEKGDQEIFTNYEFVRILRNNSQGSSTSFNTLNASKLKLANEAYEKQFQFAIEDLSRLKDLEPKLDKALKKFSAYNLRKKNDLELEIFFNKIKKGSQDYRDFKLIKKYNFDKSQFEKELWISKNRIEKMLNKSFDDRLERSINQDKYGNNNVSANSDILFHGTQVATTIASFFNFENKPNIKIMPVVVSAYGDEDDIDISNAIYYAVDNGAKVINISFSKDFSMYPEKIKKAFRYAEENDVIIIKSAGNDNRSLNDHINYPNSSKKDSLHNFIRVGASTYYLNEKLKANFSNFGNMEVDIYAPGFKIYTTDYNMEKSFESGTSLATAITSSLSALLFSYYPDLSVKDLKDVILLSGKGYDLDVRTSSSTSLFKKTENFKQLSKSGKIINAYEAFQLATQKN